MCQGNADFLLSIVWLVFELCLLLLWMCVIDCVRCCRHWQLQGHDCPIYTNVQYSFPVEPPKTPEHNPTGYYKRTFKMHHSWQQREVFLSFLGVDSARSEEHTSELQSLMRISYAVFCLKKKNVS